LHCPFLVAYTSRCSATRASRSVDVSPSPTLQALADGITSAGEADRVTIHEYPQGSRSLVPAYGGRRNESVRLSVVPDQSCREFLSKTFSVGRCPLQAPVTTTSPPLQEGWVRPPPRLRKWAGRQSLLTFDQARCRFRSSGSPSANAVHSTSAMDEMPRPASRRLW
jgi:hypothetical protein